MLPLLMEMRLRCEENCAAAHFSIRPRAQREKTTAGRGFGLRGEREVCKSSARNNSLRAGRHKSTFSIFLSLLGCAKTIARLRRTQLAAERFDGFARKRNST
jgi:hypothetical protein